MPETKSVKLGALPKAGTLINQEKPQGIGMAVMDLYSDQFKL